VGWTIRSRGRRLLFSPKLQTESAAHPVSYYVENRETKLATPLLLAPRLRMNGVVLLLPLHVFTAI
jgi:hypothetical protein